MRRPTFAAAASLWAMFAFVPHAFGQDTREDLLEKQRAQKATSLEEYQPGKLEEWMLWYEEANLKPRFTPHNGFYLQYGFRWKPVGSGFGLGAGYRHDLFDRRARIDVGGGITYRNYQMLQADFSLPYLADDRFEVGVRTVYNHNPQDDFYGLGSASVADNRVSFRANYLDLQGRAIARPRRWAQAGVRYGRMNAAIGPGTDSRFPSIEERFSDTNAPGLQSQPDFSYGEVFGAMDYRDHPGNARAGGYYAVRLRKYNDLDLNRYNFREVDLLGQQFFPIFDKKRVFALQAHLISTDPDTGDQVPFYFMPTVGGGNSLRSYNDYRFRDNNALYLNVEYRWEAFSGLDMALFYDRGTVAPTLGDLSLSEAEDAYGIGFRFNTYKAVWLRFDLGFGGREGIRYFFKFSKAF
jgi:hypothetical protein